MEFTAAAVVNFNRDLNARAHAFGNDAEILELLQDAFEMLEVFGGISEVQIDIHVLHAHAAIGVARERAAHVGGDAAGLILVFAQREQQAGGKAVGDGDEQHAAWIRAAALAERRALIGDEIGNRGLIEAHVKTVVRNLRQGDAELLLMGFFLHGGGSVHTTSCGGAMQYQRKKRAWRAP